MDEQGQIPRLEAVAVLDTLVDVTTATQFIPSTLPDEERAAASYRLQNKKLEKRSKGQLISDSGAMSRLCKRSDDKINMFR